MTTITRLLDLAHELGVHLQHHDGGPLGWYSRSLRTISTRRGLSVWDYKTTLAHELGHAYYGDSMTACGRRHTRQERRADLYAAKLLIDRTQLVDLALWHREDAHGLAIDLEVTPDLLELYLDTYPLHLTGETA